MKDLFINTEDKLKAIESLKWVDSDEGQIDFYEKTPSVAFPCALIEIDFPNCEDVHETEQTVTAQITIRLAFMPSGQTHSNVPLIHRETAFKRFEVAKDVFKALQGWETDEMSSWSRKRQVNEKRDDNLKVIAQTWETTFGEDVE